jgi:hypothetical protein
MFSSRARSASELILRMNKHSFNSRGLYNILFNFATDSFNSRINMNYVKYCNKNQVCDSGNTSVTTILVSIIFVKNVRVRNMRRNEIFVPEDVMNEAVEAVGKVVPVKSKILYEKEYNCLCNWRNKKNARGST